MDETGKQSGKYSTFSKYAPHAVAIISSLVFLDSLRFKFTNAPETQVIFSKLDGWAGTLGADGLFAQTGLFSQYVIGSAELIASTLLVIGILARFRRLQTLGFLIAFAVMSGAVSFHTLTPLGIDPNDDGGGLFFMACFIWLTSAIMLFIRRRDLLAIKNGLLGTFVPPATQS